MAFCRAYQSMSAGGQHPGERLYTAVLAMCNHQQPFPLVYQHICTNVMGERSSLGGPAAGHAAGPPARSQPGVRTRITGLRTLCWDAFTLGLTGFGRLTGHRLGTLTARSRLARRALARRRLPSGTRTRHRGLRRLRPLRGRGLRLGFGGKLGTRRPLAMKQRSRVGRRRRRRLLR